MDKTIRMIIIIGLVSIFLLLIATVANSERQEHDLMLEEAKHYQEIRQRVAKEYHMEGCSINEDLVEYCECTWERAMDEVGMNGYMKLVQEYDKTGEFADPLPTIIADCTHRHIIFRD